MPESISAGRPSTASLPSFSDADLRLLDNPIWNALGSEHAHFALGRELDNGLARRYPAAIGPLSGMAEYNNEGYDALRALAGPRGVVGLFLETKPELPAGWTMVRDGLMNQMVCEAPDSDGPTDETARAADGAEIVELSKAADGPEMVELAHLTEPGPFGERTMELGTFFGIRQHGRLVAMAGQRMSWPRFTEVSAVCTHPDVRGRGYAAACMQAVMMRIRQCGKTPMLHVFAVNEPAIRVYRGLGYTVRRTLELAVIRNDA
jgi:ribosomal protein S18 acetylase RimI-like enzyme